MSLFFLRYHHLEITIQAWIEHQYLLRIFLTTLFLGAQYFLSFV